MKPIRRCWLALLVLGTLTSTAEAHPAWGIAVDRQGRVVFCDLFHNGGTVWRVDGPGRLTPIVQNRHSHDLALDPEGRLHATHLEYLPGTQQWESRLLRVDGPGGPPREIIPPTRDGLAFWGDQFLLLEDGSVLFAFGPELRIRRGDGRTTSLAGSQARGKADGRGPNARFGSFGGFGRGPDGAFYVADDDTIRRVTADGEVTTWARGLTDPGKGSGRLFGLAVDPSGGILVADPGGRRVLRVDRAGAAPRVLLTSEAPWEPYGVATAGGVVYVLESGLVPPARFVGPRVRKIDVDGDVSTIARVPD